MPMAENGTWRETKGQGNLSTLRVGIVPRTQGHAAFEGKAHPIQARSGCLLNRGPFGFPVGFPLEPPPKKDTIQNTHIYLSWQKPTPCCIQPQLSSSLECLVGVCVQTTRISSVWPPLLRSLDVSNRFLFQACAVAASGAGRSSMFRPPGTHRKVHSIRAGWGR